MKFSLDISEIFVYNTKAVCQTTRQTSYGGIAQLGARFIKCMPPLSNQTSTTSYLHTSSSTIRGYSSAGRALEWHSRGQRFDPAYLHHTRRAKRLVFKGKQAFFLTFFKNPTYPISPLNRHFCTRLSDTPTFFARFMYTPISPLFLVPFQLSKRSNCGALFLFPKAIAHLQNRRTPFMIRKKGGHPR